MKKHRRSGGELISIFSHCRKVFTETGSVVCVGHKLKTSFGISKQK